MKRPPGLVVTGLIAFVLLGVMLLPIPIVTTSYGEWLRFQSKALWAHPTQRHDVMILPAGPTEPGKSNIFVRDAGNVAPFYATIDNRVIGLAPTAVYLALFFASVPRVRQRVRRFAVGFVLTSLFVGLRMGVLCAMAWIMHARRCPGPHSELLKSAAWEKAVDLALNLIVFETSILVLVPAAIWFFTSFPRDLWGSIVLRSTARLRSRPDQASSHAEKAPAIAARRKRGRDAGPVGVRAARRRK